MKIYFIRPYSTQYQDVSNMLISVATKIGASVMLSDMGGTSDSYSSEVTKHIKEADLVIADITGPDSHVLLELGLATGIQKPFALICQQDTPIAPELMKHRVYLYDRSRLAVTLHPIISQALIQASKQGDINNKKPTKQADQIKQKTVFISYSHADDVYLTRLDVHLRPFEKSGQVELWSDKRINAGDKWKEKIEQALGKAAIAILLVSADFLASDFIIDNELPPLLKAAEEKGTMILPVILKPCRFTKHETLSGFQAINDPKTPLSKMDENDREETYVKIADRIGNLL
jgi:hypothetical protein